MSRTSRSPVFLSEPVHRQLNMYALAAGAAGVSLLAHVQPAEGKIVYTKTHHVIYGIGSYIDLDLNHDGLPDFRLGIDTIFPFYGSMLVAFATLFSANSVRTSKGGAVAFPPGVRIGPKQRFARPPEPSFGILMEYGGCTNTRTCQPRGNWLNVKNRYLGLAFLIKGKTHYGWARLSASITQRGRVRATLTGYAYETVPNKPIITGHTKGPNDNNVEESISASLAVPTPQPCTLGLLALGAPGQPIWRREKSTGAGPSEAGSLPTIP